MRIRENSIFLRDGRKIGTIAKSSHGYIAALNLPTKGCPSAAGSGETELEAIDDARQRIWADMDAAGGVLRLLLDEMEDYQPGAVRREIVATTDALNTALRNVESLKAKLTRLGVGTDRAERIEDTIRKTRQTLAESTQSLS